MICTEIWQCHVRKVGNATNGSDKFCSTTFGNLAVPRIVVWQCHARKFGSAESGRETCGSLGVSSLAMPRMEV